MVNDPKQAQAHPSAIKQWFRRWRLDLVFVAVFVGMIVWIIWILAADWPDKPSWLLVPLTVIYAVLTLYMAAAAFQNAQAARRSAEAMEASVEEQRLSRWAAYAAIVSFPNGPTYKEESDGSLSVILGNLFRQPIMGLRVGVWYMDQNASGHVRYSTMMESNSIDVDPATPTVTVQLRPTNRPETERVHFGNLALERYKRFFNDQTPRSVLCLIEFSHRANLSAQHLVYDLTAAPTAPLLTPTPPAP